ncbi:organic solute transporter alpha-like protein [Schistocerca serialis cubense]|uniref:organic solute transporter alpha-like protein n=1 Tax=Schistocerca serialis cubense TaxID=2023355 RepID=UPI00214E4EEC|nr:organic solute transporter alpha-like protein [Schistocerca serialis cubense]
MEGFEYNATTGDSPLVLPPVRVSAMSVNRTAGATCEPEMVPSLRQYYTAMNVVGMSLFSAGAMAVAATLLLYVDTLRHVIGRAPSAVKTHTALVLSIYPVVASVTYCAVVVPRAQLLSEAVTQGSFMVCLYQLFCLLVAYCGGEAELIRRAKPSSLDPAVGPCCCWPCCRLCLKPAAVNKCNVRKLRLLVLQLPMVQGLIYMVLLVMWAEEESLYQVNYMYLQPVVVLSILCAIWGISMTLRLLAELLSGHRAQAKFLALQFVLLLAKLQGLSARAAVWTGLLPCRPPITPAVYSNLVYNSLMLGEMVILSIWARSLYKKPLPDMGLPAQRPMEVCVLSNLYPHVLSSLNNNTITCNNNNTGAVDNNSNNRNGSCSNGERNEDDSGKS